MKKLNNYTNIGLIFNGIFLFASGTGILPEFIKGFCAGLGWTLIALGIYAQKHDINKLKDMKRNFFKKF